MRPAGSGPPSAPHGGATTSHGASSATGATAAPALDASVRAAIDRTCRWLLDRQHSDGHWVAELQGDTILESESILLLAFLGRERSRLAGRLAEYLVQKQLPGGGWALYPGGPAEISGSVKAYFALKLTGHPLSAEYMQRARAAILAAGGADRVNSYTRFYLAMLGQISYEQCPAVPPQMALLPRWFPVHLGAVSTWSRTIFVPLSIVSALQPVRRLAAEQGIRELFLKAPEDWPPPRCPGRPQNPGWLSWDTFFLAVDKLLKWLRRRGWTPLRCRAVHAAAEWMLARFERSDGPGAIYPPIVWSLVALRALGYPDDSPEVRYCRHHLESLVLEDPQSGAARVQPCKSPVWDTSITLRALGAAGVAPGHPGVEAAVRWLLDRQIRVPGDWAHTVKAAPGGWCFEYHNDFYPDCDDTVMALMALEGQFSSSPRPERGDAGRSGGDGRPARHAHDARAAGLLEDTTAAIDRGLSWVLAMQNDDGGWGAFDRNNNRQFLCRVPFADHNAMIDPSSPDLTGRVVEAMGTLGRRVGDPAVDRAVAYLRAAQEPDGSWFGRWGVNHIYGTWQALVGLSRVGVPHDDPAVVAGANWLLSCQQPCGGWGESPDSYANPRLRGQGPVTASQTAWALTGLMAAGLCHHAAVQRGVRWLLQRQRPDGAWDEQEFTGTGFPQVFYLRYHYYPVYFPLLALSIWRRRQRFASDAANGHECDAANATA